MTRLFFVTYCFGDYQGWSLIGVDKRGLRIALELADRGHEVVFSSQPTGAVKVRAAPSPRSGSG